MVFPPIFLSLSNKVVFIALSNQIYISTSSSSALLDYFDKSKFIYRAVKGILINYAVINLVSIVKA